MMGALDIALVTRVYIDCAFRVYFENLANFTMGCFGLLLIWVSRTIGMGCCN